jgi:hypothetical protein
MKRRLFNILAAVSLVLALAVAGLWVRSVFWAADYFCYMQKSMMTCTVVSYEGRLAFNRFRTQSLLTEMHFTNDAQSTQWLPPVEYLKQYSAPGSASVGVSDWLLLAIFMIIPSWKATRHVWSAIAHPKQLNALALDLCPACGYDLRASQGECLECGAKIAAPLDAVKVGEQDPP